MLTRTFQRFAHFLIFQSIVLVEVCGWETGIDGTDKIPIANKSCHKPLCTIANLFSIGFVKNVHMCDFCALLGVKNVRKSDIYVLSETIPR